MYLAIFDKMIKLIQLYTYIMTYIVGKQEGSPSPNKNKIICGIKIKQCHTGIQINGYILLVIAAAYIVSKGYYRVSSP